MLHLLIPDPALGAAVTEQLALAGFEVAENGSDAAASGAAFVCDEAALDKKTLKTLQDAYHAGRCVFLLGAAADGAEDFITESFPKPLRLGHLLARLQFHLETAPRLRGAHFTFGPYSFEPQTRQITVDGSGTVIRLTEKETALLEYLGQSNRPVGREELLASIWGYDGRIDTHTLETHIYQLRRKLDAGGDNVWLINEQGAYRLNRA